MGNVLHIITGLSTGGAERALYNVLAGGLGQKFETTVLSLRDEGSMGGLIRDLGVPVHSLYMRQSIPTPVTVTRLRKIVREIRPDLIQGWMYHGNLAASVAARLALGRPAVAWNVRQSLYELKTEKPITRQVIRANRLWSGKTNAIIYNSCLSRSQHETFGFQGSRAMVIPNGFDPDLFLAHPETGTAVRNELGMPDDVVVVGHVARFHPMKDHASFLRAAVRVTQENPATRFLLVGREVSLSNPALADIVPPELLGRFVFTGERSDVQRLMQAMDIFCLSSRSEAFPNVLGEAMACGVPCVTTNVGDSADIVGDSGIVVPPANSQALVSGLQMMARKSQKERRALGRVARERVQTRYGLDSVVARYADLYERMGV